MNSGHMVKVKVTSGEEKKSKDAHRYLTVISNSRVCHSPRWKKSWRKVGVRKGHCVESRYTVELLSELLIEHLDVKCLKFTDCVDRMERYT